MSDNHHRPILYALLAALLFGAATPASKILLTGLSSFQLAGLLYVGAALGVMPVALRGGRIRLPDRADRRNRLALSGAILAGGVMAPVLLLLGLHASHAVSVSLWLNFELAATAILGVLLFRDHLDLTGWTGVACTFAGAVVLSLGGGVAGLWAGGLVLLACVLWGLDNHLTGLVDGITPAESTFWKGSVAGMVNVAIGLAIGPPITSLTLIGAALIVGAIAYGASITLYITSAHALGPTRSQIVFSSAPFFGVLFSAIGLGEPLTLAHAGAGLLFVAGIVFLIVHRHSHVHEHVVTEHEHEHYHGDGHHDHEHGDRSGALRHAHRHVHGAEVHEHMHMPDLHHRHDHDTS